MQEYMVFLADGSTHVILATSMIPSAGSPGALSVTFEMRRSCHTGHTGKQVVLYAGYQDDIED